MSEDDRAAKAARAKAMLKKRQQKKAAESGVGQQSDTASLPSRTATPALAEVVEEKRPRDNIDDVFGTAKEASDSSWLSSLPRAPSPPPTQLATPTSLPPKSPVPHAGPQLDLLKEVEALQTENTSLKRKVQDLERIGSETRKAEENIKELQELLDQKGVQYTALEVRYDELRKDTDLQLKNHNSTISLLVSEKASLTNELHRLDEVETRAQNAEESLNQEKIKSAELDSQLRKLTGELKNVSENLEELRRKEKQLNDKQREQERQLQLATASAAEARKDAERYQRSLQELEEQIQSDDRLERAEASLKNTQDRADELEFQLSKLKHAHSTLKAEKESLESQLSQLVDARTEVESKYSELQEEHDAMRQQVSELTSERGELSAANDSLDQLNKAKDATIAALSTQLNQAATEITSQNRQVQALQSELKSAQRHAEDAEKAQQRLQSEGTNLMRSLDELRPKVVELTEDKVQLSEQISHLKHTLRERDDVISKLEANLEEVRQEAETAKAGLEAKVSQLESERSQTAMSSSEMEKGYAELQQELDNAMESVRALEAERQSMRQEAQARLQELEKLSNTSRTQAADIMQLQNELHERQTAEEERDDFLEQAQNEIESLRAELNTKSTELENVRQSASIPAVNGTPPSLNEEMLNSLRQQHAMDLSAAQSQIRALENSVFDAEARTHALQKQVHSLEAQLASARPSSRLGGHQHQQSRPSTRSDHGRSSFHTQQRPVPLSRSIFDQTISEETRHKRKISLSMLKARIESEVSAAAINPGSPSRVLSPVHSRTGSDSSSQPDFTHHYHYEQKIPHRSQFLDESHVFWCSSCSGELVVL